MMVLYFNGFNARVFFFVGCIQALFTQNWNDTFLTGTSSNVSGFYISWYGLIGGCLWSCANTLASLVVKYFHLNMGFVGWNIVNIVTAYVMLQFNFIHNNTNNNNNATPPFDLSQKYHVILNFAGIVYRLYLYFGYGYCFQ